MEAVSAESIGDIAYVLKNGRRTKRLRALLLIAGLSLSILQWVSLAVWITTGAWQLFAGYAPAAVLAAVFIGRLYFRKARYICPQCHAVFQPDLKQWFWARHTPRLRKLTCTRCGAHGFCIETCAAD